MESILERIVNIDLLEGVCHKRVENTRIFRANFWEIESRGFLDHVIFEPFVILYL